jgi:hypothetical protein
MHKAGTTEYTKENTMELLFSEQQGIWYLVVENRRGHAIDQIACSEDSIAPKSSRYVVVEKHSAGWFNQMFILPFDNTVLLRRIWAKGLMKNAL